MHLHLESERVDISRTHRTERRFGIVDTHRRGQEKQIVTTTNLTDNLVKIDARTGGGKK